MAKKIKRGTHESRIPWTAEEFKDINNYYKQDTQGLQKWMFLKRLLLLGIEQYKKQIIEQGFGKELAKALD